MSETCLWKKDQIQGGVSVCAVGPSGCNWAHSFGGKSNGCIVFAPTVQKKSRKIAN